MARRSRSAALLWVCSGLVAVAGAVLVVIGLLTPVGVASFGWFAYQPLAGESFSPGGPAVILSRLSVVGWVLLAGGAVALAFLAGRAVGRRSRA